MNKCNNSPQNPRQCLACHLLIKVKEVSPKTLALEQNTNISLVLPAPGDGTKKDKHQEQTTYDLIASPHCIVPHHILESLQLNSTQSNNKTVLSVQPPKNNITVISKFNIDHKYCRKHVGILNHQYAVLTHCCLSF